MFDKSAAAAVNLATGVTGTLPPGNGGTGVANNASSTLTISGAFGTTFTVSGATSLTLPTSGTLATTATSAWVPSSDVTITQNSVAVITSIATSATVNTLYLKQGRVGIGLAPDVLANRSALQILGLGTGLGQITLADTLADNTNKNSGIGMGHYQLAWAVFQLFFGTSTTSANTLNLGGGNSSNPAATEVAIYAAANTTTTTGTKILSCTTAKATISVPFVLANYTVATLPSASTSGAGATAFVTDASTTFALSLGLTVLGSGSNKVPVYSDGTNWIVG